MNKTIENSLNTLWLKLADFIYSPYKIIKEKWIKKIQLIIPSWLKFIDNRFGDNGKCDFCWHYIKYSTIIIAPSKNIWLQVWYDCAKKILGWNKVLDDLYKEKKKELILALNNFYDELGKIKWFESFIKKKLSKSSLIWQIPNLCEIEYSTWWKKYDFKNEWKYLDNTEDRKNIKNLCINLKSKIVEINSLKDDLVILNKEKSFYK